MIRIRAYAAAAHAGPTLAVTVIMTVFAWSAGWRGLPLALLAATVLVGQLSIGWSNDAADAVSDLRADRTDKPTVSAGISARSLWVAASVALVLACVLSWSVAGPVGGSFHVLFVAMGWLYNVAVSRTVWSWVPYAVGFGALPMFVYLGLGDGPAPAWTVAVFALLAVSAHLANALRDVEVDRDAHLGGLVVRLGARWATIACWVLLGVGTLVLVVVSVARGRGPLLATVLVVAYVGAVVWGSAARRRSAMFDALLVVAVVDVVALTVTAG